MNFSQGHSGTEVRCVNRAWFLKEKHQNSQKWAKFMNFSFWPFLWFGLPGRLLILSGVAPANQTEESEVCELPGKESGTGSGTPFCL